MKITSNSQKLFKKLDKMKNQLKNYQFKIIKYLF